MFHFNPDNPFAFFLHGVRADTQRILPLINLIQDRYNIIAFDLPGYGKSERYLSKEIIHNHIQFCSDLLIYLIREFNIPSSNLALFGISYGANIVLNTILQNRNFQKTRKIVLFIPIFSKDKLSMSFIDKYFTKFYLKVLALDFIPTKIFQFVINHRSLYKFCCFLFDKEAYVNQEILEYDIKQWKLSRISLLASNIHEFLNIDLSKHQTQNIENIVFAYPEKDPFIDVDQSILGFKRLFPQALFYKFASNQHTPRGEFDKNEQLIAEIQKTITILKI